MLASKASKVIEDVPGREVNLMHYSSDTVKKSKIPTYQSTNGFFSLNQYVSGSTSTVIIPPNHGLEKIVLGVKLPDAYDGLVANPTSANALGAGAYDGLALPAGWVYSLIQQINYRIAGSADFTLSGEALRAACLMNASNSGQKQQLLTGLAGAAIAGRSTVSEVSDFVGQNLYGYAVLSIFGLSSQSGTETPCPLPTDLSNGPITITIQWKNFERVFATNGSTAVAVPLSLEKAWVQTRQLFPIDSADRLKLSGAQKYMYPMTYYQQEIQIPLSGTSASITGIKEGQCRGLYMFLTRRAPNAAANAANATTFLQASDITLTYNGVVIHRFDGLGAAQMLDTLYSDVAGYFEAKTWLAAASPAIGFVARPETAGGPYSISNYYHAPFAQRFEQFSGMSDMTLMNGISLGAGSIQVGFGKFYDENNVEVLPTDVVLHIVPYLVSALSFDASGNVEYVF